MIQRHQCWQNKLSTREGVAQLVILEVPVEMELLQAQRIQTMYL